MEVLMGVEPNTYAQSAVWAENNRYYIDGKAVPLPMSLFQSADTDAIGEAVRKNQALNDHSFFEENIRLFAKANADRLNYLESEAYAFVNEVAAKYAREKIVISFSGGKDSTATAHLVTTALSDPSIIHIFLSIRFADFLGEPDQKLSPPFGLLLHVDARQELRPLVIVRTHPATYAVISQSIRLVEVDLFRQQIQPNVDVLPEEYRRSYGLLLYLDGLRTVFHPVIFAATDGFRLPDPVKSQYLIRPVQTV